MNQAQAIAKLKKLLGAKFGYRIDRAAPVGEARERLRDKLVSAAQIAETAVEARRARYEELLRDPQYVELSAAAKAAKDTCANLRGRLLSHRVTVGHVGEMFFSVEAQGDDWQEVVDKVVEKKAKA